MRIEKNKLAEMIDHTVLRPEATPSQIEKLCAEAREYGFASVCINPSYVKTAFELLKDSSVAVCTVIGFPLGANTSGVKAAEAREAVENGASEIDMVINIGALKTGNIEAVKNDIEAVVAACSNKAKVKVIIETCFLTDDEKIKACLAAKDAGAHFVKTSTGFGKGGATIEDIKLMRKTVGLDMGVKASGGIKDYQTARAMILAGADRLGTSRSVEILNGAK